jgi:hypothetical protein
MEKSSLQGECHKIFTSVLDMEISVSSAHDYLNFMIQCCIENLQRYLNVRNFIGADSARFRRVRTVSDSVDNGDKSDGCDADTGTTNRLVISLTLAIN